MTRYPPCPNPFNLTAHVLARATGLSDHPALEILHPKAAEIWTFGRLQAAVLGAGTGLRALGLTAGDRVVLCLGATPAFPVAFLGAIAVGLVPIPVSPLLTPREYSQALTVLNPSAVIRDDAADAGVPVSLTSAEILAMEGLPPCPYNFSDPNRMAYVIFTSGTSSGRPLPVAHAHRAIWARGMMHQGWQGLRPGDRVLHAGAFNWTYTLGAGLMDPWTCGATALIPAFGHQTADLPDMLHRHRATIFAAFPGIYRRLLRKPLPPMPTLRHGLSAGEALPARLRDDWRAATGTDLHEALGMTEVSTYLSGAPDRPAPIGTLGFAQAGRQIALLNTDGLPVTPGNPGEIAVHMSDPGLMLGYLDRPDDTRARYRDDWFATGDWALQTAQGAFVGLGRRDDLINAGGIRVSPAEVEEALRAFAGLTDCTVTEVEVAPGTRVIAAFYTAPAPLDDAALSAHCAGLLAPYKCPRLFRQIPQLPRGAHEKLNRRALQRSFCQSSDHDPS